MHVHMLKLCRQHCSLELLCQGINEEVLKITSLSKAAPTQVYRAGASDPEILCTGQIQRLALIVNPAVCL